MSDIINEENYHNKVIGKKAENLFILKEEEINIPEFFCVMIQDLEREGIKKEIEYVLTNTFKNIKSFSVRSSCNMEDGEENSFAGQFTTYLNVPKDQVVEFVYRCSKSINQEKIKDYKAIEVEQFEGSIMIQEMIEADISGVFFTANPQGILNEGVIVAGEGTGDHVVEDRVNTTAYYYHYGDKLYYKQRQEEAFELSKEQIEELIRLRDTMEKLLGKYLDIEYCIKNKKLYILQARRITTLKKEKEIVLDNSNIVESYPGITLPLTESFVKEVYYQVFKSCLKRLTKEEKTVLKADPVLRNMAASANGRIYYQISSWYDVLLFLPFHKKIISIWQEMLGVENKEITFTLQGKIKGITRVKVLISFFQLLLTNPREMEKLNHYFLQIQTYFKDRYSEELSNKELIYLYKDLEAKVAGKWDITLVNDMYSFLYTSFVKKQLKKEYKQSWEDIANRLISNISDLESMKPVKKLIEIAVYAKSRNQYDILNSISSIEDYEAYMRHENQLTEMIGQYIETFGDRNVEELKLESETFRTNPLLFIQKLLEYMSDGKLEDCLPAGQQIVDFNLSKKVKRYLKKAETGIRNRELSRLNRSRLYGIMRTIILRIAENFTSENLIQEKEDIFYLYYDELEQVIGGEKLDLKSKVNDRKALYQAYEKLPAYSRLVFDGKISNKNPYLTEQVEPDFHESKLRGIPCSTGTVIGEVVVIENGKTSEDVKDKILVAKMTDPGWVFYITRAKGIIAERGSLLSHTAIISRELKKPAVVGVKNVVNILKTGDIVKLDGVSGEIEIIEKGKSKKL